MARDAIVLSADDISRAVTRIAHEILENNKGPEHLVLLGIHTRGVPLARRLAAKIAEVEAGVDPAALTGALDITLHRDDLRTAPLRTPEVTELPPGGIDGATVVLVDDVLYTGRTIRAAMDALLEIGRPRAIRLAVLVDRGHRELPIRADFVGKNLPTAQAETVRVLLAETDGEDRVQITADGGTPRGQAGAPRTAGAGGEGAAQ